MSETKMIDEFVNKYSLSKTISFALKSVGKTKENFNNNQLEKDRDKSKNLRKIQKYAFEFHSNHIEKSLKNVKNLAEYDIKNYKDLYRIKNRDDDQQKLFNTTKENLKSSITNKLKEGNEHLVDKNFFDEILPNDLKNKNNDDYETYIEAYTNSFKKSICFFEKFRNSIKNFYGTKTGSVASRCIDDNLPIFLDNLNIYKIHNEEIPICESDDSNAFDIKNYKEFLTQDGINNYNKTIGIVNEKINKINQTKKNKKDKIPYLKTLQKQIISNVVSTSYEPFKTDKEVIAAIVNYYNNSKSSMAKINELIGNLSKYDLSLIYIYKKWFPKNYEEIFTDLSDVLNNLFSNNTKKFAISKLTKSSENAINDLHDYSDKLIKNIDEKWDDLDNIKKNEELKKEDKDSIKVLLDSILNYERFLKALCGTGKEKEREWGFYHEFCKHLEKIKEIELIYNKTRNYFTKKPYSKDKIKLWFDNYQLMDGWDVNNETKCCAVLLRDKEKYYLAVMDKKKNKTFENITEVTEDVPYFEKMVYKQIADPKKYFSKKTIVPKKECPSDEKCPDEIKKIFEKKENEEELTEQEHKELIKYVAEKFIPNYKEIQDKNGNCYFNFDLKNIYNENEIKFKTYNEFLDSLTPNCYHLHFEKISEEYVLKNVEDGNIYLFEIYCKDFSDKSKGKPNLHTLYFKMLFDEKNLNNSNIVYKLSGGAEMFFRKSSKIKNNTIHEANKPIPNKNPNNPKKNSNFTYSITKDKRFTEDRFLLKLPIELNYAKDCKSDAFNKDIQTALKNKKKDDIRIIGIDRGQRNLIYISVIDGNGNLIDQKSLNVIESVSKNGTPLETDYKHLIKNRSEDMKDNQTKWHTVGNIKNLKEGYISQAVHEVCKLVVQHDAIIAIENLNCGFTKKAEYGAAVYKKFEDMLIQKLNYLVDDKNKINDECGGLLKAYQLTTTKKEKYQNGIVFYVPPDYTSAIDPTTGFVDLLKPKYKNIKDSQNFFKNFSEIEYNKEKDYFEFKFNYKKFGKEIDQEWTVCTYGERICHYKDNSKWKTKTGVLSDNFKNLFSKYKIGNYKEELQKKIINQEDEEFFKELIRLFYLTLQMRNTDNKSDKDYIISPIKNSEGVFYYSEKYKGSDKLPCDADANGAYNIAKKGLLMVNNIREKKEKPLEIKNNDWFKYAIQSLLAFPEGN